MKKVKDLTGKRFGRLVVIALEKVDKGAQFLCKCDCGKSGIFYGKYLSAGDTRSCGCLRKEAVIKGLNLKHGKRHSRTYRIWGAMLYRCKNPKANFYYNYGGRGIKVCEGWHNFPNFLNDMGEAPDGYSIDRVDSNGNYEKSNCRWADRATQSRNKSSNIMVNDGINTMCVADWAKETGIKASTLYARKRRGNLHLQPPRPTPIFI